MNQPDFINKRVRQKMKQKHKSAMLIKQWLSTTEYLKNKQNPYLMSLSHQILPSIRKSTKG